MIQRHKYTAAVSHADLAATDAALAAVSGRFEGMFSIPLIEDGDADDLDPPRYWGTVVQVKPDERQELKNAIVGVIASLKWEEVDSRKPAEDEDLIDAFAAKYDYRRPGHIIEAYGTALASGGAGAQSLDGTATLLDQWSSLMKLINMDNQGQRFKIKTAGTYELGVRLLFEPVDGVTFSARAARNAEVIGGTLTCSVGNMQGTVEGVLSVDDLIGIGVWASAAADFKLLGGSKIRLKRIA